MTKGTPYDAELGKITDQDREYAADLIDDIEESINDRATQIATTAQWLRKVRYEAVIADRKVRDVGRDVHRRPSGAATDETS